MNFQLSSEGHQYRFPKDILNELISLTDVAWQISIQCSSIEMPIMSDGLCTRILYWQAGNSTLHSHSGPVMISLSGIILSTSGIIAAEDISNRINNTFQRVFNWLRLLFQLIIIVK